jgi:hypothetical protein
MIRDLGSWIDAEEDRGRSLWVKINEEHTIAAQRQILGKVYRERGLTGAPLKY